MLRLDSRLRQTPGSPSDGLSGRTVVCTPARIRGWLAGSGWVLLYIFDSHGPFHFRFPIFNRLLVRNKQPKPAAEESETPLTTDALWTGILVGVNPLFSLNTKLFVHPKSA